MALEIPLDNTPEQLFSVVLEGEVYDCRVIYNTRIGQWSISFAQNGVDILNGIAMSSGVNLVKQFNLPFEQLWLINFDNPRQDATVDNLGTGARLYVLSNEEVEALDDGATV